MVVFLFLTRGWISFCGDSTVWGLAQRFSSFYRCSVLFFNYPFPIPFGFFFFFPCLLFTNLFSNVQTWEFRGARGGQLGDIGFTFKALIYSGLARPYQIQITIYVSFKAMRRGKVSGDRGHGRKIRYIFCVPTPFNGTSRGVSHFRSVFFWVDYLALST